MQDLLVTVRRYLIIAACAPAAVLPGIAEGHTTKEVFARVSGSVVTVTTVAAAGEQEAQGSGVVVGANGTDCFSSPTAR